MARERYSAQVEVPQHSFQMISLAGWKYSSGLPAIPVFVSASQSRELPLRGVPQTRYDVCGCIVISHFSSLLFYHRLSFFAALRISWSDTQILRCAQNDRHGEHSGHGGSGLPARYPTTFRNIYDYVDLPVDNLEIIHEVKPGFDVYRP